MRLHLMTSRLRLASLINGIDEHIRSFPKTQNNLIDPKVLNRSVYFWLHCHITILS